MLSLLPLLLSTATIGAPVAPRARGPLLESAARHVRTIDKRVQRPAGHRVSPNPGRSRR